MASPYTAGGAERPARVESILPARCGLRRRGFDPCRGLPHAIGLTLAAVILSAACGPADAMGNPSTQSPLPTRVCPQPFDAPLADPGSTEAMRCEQIERTVRTAVSVDGTVLGEMSPGHPGQPLADTAVTLHALDKAGGGTLGKVLARTTTDAQGHFHLSLQLEPGEYFVAARAEAHGAVLAMSRVTLSQHGAREISEVRLWVPLDPRLRGAKTAE